MLFCTSVPDVPRLLRGEDVPPVCVPLLSDRQVCMALEALRHPYFEVECVPGGRVRLQMARAYLRLPDGEDLPSLPVIYDFRDPSLAVPDVKSFVATFPDSVAAHYGLRCEEELHDWKTFFRMELHADLCMVSSLFCLCASLVCLSFVCWFCPVVFGLVLSCFCVSPHY